MSRAENCSSASTEISLDITRSVSLTLDRLEALKSKEASSLAFENGSANIDRIIVVRGYLRARRLREQILPANLFADPAWDILLDLYAADLEDRPVSISSACIAATVPPTTGLRWLNRLIDSQLVVRANDGSDGRRTNVELMPSVRQLIERWVNLALVRDSIPFLA